MKTKLSLTIYTLVRLSFKESPGGRFFGRVNNYETIFKNELTKYRFGRHRYR